MGKGMALQLNSPAADKLFLSLYGPERIEPNRRRYAKPAEELLDRNIFSSAGVPPEEEIRLYTNARRTELGGNHADHNHSKILAASINLDIAAAVVKRPDEYIVFRSSGFPDAGVCLDELHPKPEERRTAEALIRSIASAFIEKGVPTGGMTVNADSMVFPGFGLSSSAAAEALFEKIIDDLYGQGNRSSVEIAQIGQYAENNFFGKPCALMAQIACAAGGTVSVDFADPKVLKIKAVLFDPADVEFLLCIINTRGNHADLTSDYVTIPGEMKSTAAFFGKSVLRDVNYTQIIPRGNEIRKSCGALTHDFLTSVPIDEGSYPGDCRFHGGDFAGTIQAYIPRKMIKE
jgi:galactokinase